LHQFEVFCNFGFSLVIRIKIPCRTRGIRQAGGRRGSRAGFRGDPGPRPPIKPLKGKGKEGEDGRDCPLSEIPNTLLGPRPPTS